MPCVFISLLSLFSLLMPAISCYIFTHIYQDCTIGIGQMYDFPVSIKLFWRTSVNLSVANHCRHNKAQTLQNSGNVLYVYVGKHRCYPDSKVHGANMGPSWCRQYPGGPHVGPMNFVIWVCMHTSLESRDGSIIFKPIIQKSSLGTR